MTKPRYATAWQTAEAAELELGVYGAEATRDSGYAGFVQHYELAALRGNVPDNLAVWVETDGQGGIVAHLSRDEAVELGLWR